MRVREGNRGTRRGTCGSYLGCCMQRCGVWPPPFFAPSCIHNVNIPLIIKQRECSHAPSMNTAGASFIFRATRSGGELGGVFSPLADLQICHFAVIVLQPRCDFPCVCSQGKHQKTASTVLLFNTGNTEKTPRLSRK